MERKTSKVTLLDSSNGVTHDFEVSHAERILKYPGSEWKLPEDSPYQYTRENGINFRSNKGEIKKTGTHKRNPKSDKTSK